MSDIDAAGPRPPELDGFLANARQGRIAFPRCGACGRFHWYPMPRCPHCRSSAIAWQPVAGRAEVFSFTIVRHPFDKRRAEALPYVVALVTFADAPGVRLITSIVGAGALDVSIGETVEPLLAPDDPLGAVVTFRRSKGGLA